MTTRKVDKGCTFFLVRHKKHVFFVQNVQKFKKLSLSETTAKLLFCCCCCVFVVFLNFRNILRFVCIMFRPLDNDSEEKLPFLFLVHCYFPISIGIQRSLNVVSWSNNNCRLHQWKLILDRFLASLTINNLLALMKIYFYGQVVVVCRINNRIVRRVINAAKCCNFMLNRYN